MPNMYVMKKNDARPVRRKWRRVHDDWQCAKWRYETSGDLWAEVFLDKKQGLYTGIILGIGHGKNEKVTSRPAIEGVRTFVKAKALALEALAEGITN